MSNNTSDDDDGGGTERSEVIFNCFRTLDESKFMRQKHEDDDPVDRMRFLQAVDRSLELYAGRKLKKFYLGCCFLENHLNCLDRWMQTVAGLDVEELHLCYKPCGIRGSRFTFRFQLISGLYSLRMLCLFFCNIVPEPAGFVGHLKSLVTMVLDLIPLANNELSDFILPYCPNLEYLFLTRCKLPCKTSISGGLKSLHMLYCYGLDELQVSAGNLVDFCIDSSVRVELNLSYVPELQKLSLVPNRKHSYYFGDHINKWDLPKLTTLVLKPIFDLDEVPCLPSTFDMFGNVRVLYLLMARHWNGTEESAQIDLCNLTPVFSACPLLETFYFMVEGRHRNEERGVGWPSLRHKHLKHMELAGFSNTQNELGFARFVMASAQVLQKLVLRSTLMYIAESDVVLEISLKPEGVAQVDEMEANMISRDLLHHALSDQATVEIR